jgi:NAD(P)-dependent dehydrogenase (short-subunit alcohol dehydrogenase family)
MNHGVDLSGQVALVTGATSGLGRRFAEVLAGAGAATVITGRRFERLSELAAEIAAAGGTVLPLQLDVTDAEEIADVVGRASDELGPVTVLVNNAGIPDAQRATKMPLELVDAVFDTNLRGPWLLSTEVARRLIADRLPGRMVNISSMGAFRYDNSGAALYSVTKAAIVRMTEALAVEWAAAARPDAAVPVFVRERGRHRHGDQGRRRPGVALTDVGLRSPPAPPTAQWVRAPVPAHR